MSVAFALELDEHELYPVHEEAGVPEKPAHERQVRYLRNALEAWLPGHWVTGEVCMYWEQMAFGQYRAPDVLVVERPTPADLPPVYLKWSDGPALFVLEIGSKSTFREDEGPKIERYLLDLEVPEYLYCMPDPMPNRRRIQMWTLMQDQVTEVAPLSNGRLLSRTLDLEFGFDDGGSLRAYTRSGEVLPDAEEALGDLKRERARADAERARADAERARADAERAFAEAERIRSAKLEQEIQRLQGELRRLDIEARSRVESDEQ